MKKNAAFFVLSLSALALFFSCSKKSDELLPVPPKPAESFQKATILTDKLHLCLFGRDEKMHKIIKLNKSSAIDILYTENVLESKNVEGTVFYPAVYESCDYWVDGTALALNSIPAVVIEKTVPYEDKELQQPLSNLTLKFGSTIALSLQEDHITENACLAYFIDSQDGTLKSAWIIKSAASSREDDIVVMQVVEGLKVTKRATPRNELFKKAAKYNPCAEVRAALKAQQVELVENNYQEVLNALPGARIKVNVPELLTVDQSKDPFKR